MRSPKLGKRGYLIVLAVSLVAAFQNAASGASEQAGGDILDHRPGPASLPQMVGEWTGLVPGGDVLLTLHVHSDRSGVLAITEPKGDRIVTQIHSLVGLRVVQGGRFSISSLDGVVQIVGQAQHDLGFYGEGYARVAINDPKEGKRTLGVHLFLLTGDSWIQRILELEATATHRKD